MKRLFWTLSFLMLSLAGFIACNKNASPASGSKTSGTSNATLTLSATRIQKGAPLIATVANSAAENIRWTVTPSTAAHITTGNGQAMILFAEAGKYQIKASYVSGADSADSATCPITVSDTVYTPVPPTATDTTSLAGVGITLTPSLDTIGRLILLGQSTTVYNCFPTFVWSVSQGQFGSVAVDNGEISLIFYEVISTATGSGCDGAQNPATAYLFPEQYLTGPPAAGTYPINVMVNQTLYQGTYTVTTTGYTFNWPYTSGVTISPTQINQP
jgi:hypothetical protein